MAPKSEKNGAKSNGKSKAKVPTTSKSKNEKPASVPLALSAIILILAFIGGILTPPARQLINELTAGSIDTTFDESNASIVSNHLPHVPCTHTNLDNYLHATPVNGLHIICFEALKFNADMNEKSYSPDVSRRRRIAESNALRLTFYKKSFTPKLKRRVLIKEPQIVTSFGADSYRHIVRELGLRPSGSKKQPWALFSALGEKIVDETSGPAGFNESVLNRLASSEMVILTEGGNWIWPGVAEGFRRKVDVTSPNKEPREVTIETLSLKPLVVSIEGFLDEEECDYIAEKAGPMVQYSQVSLMDKDKGKAASEWRTSQSAFLNSMNDEILTEIDHKVASLTRIPKNHGEYAQVLRYGHNEKYDSHHDFFNPAFYKNDPGTMRLIENGKRNRFATVFWYLTDVDDGGETIFPRYGGLPPPRDHAQCSVGLKVKPQKGKVIIFYSLDAAGELDDYSLHGACPVGEGYVKWAANKWIWNAPMHFIPE
jgi:prolyl 4-hydroxylase